MCPTYMISQQGWRAKLAKHKRVLHTVKGDKGLEHTVDSSSLIAVSFMMI